MATLYHNINGAGSFGTTMQLLAPGDISDPIKSIAIAPTSGAVNVSLAIKSTSFDAATSSFALLKSVSIPASVTLLLDDPGMLSYNSSIYGLYIVVGSSDTVDVTINI